MNAKDVFSIAKHLEMMELIKLIALIEEKIISKKVIANKKNRKIPNQKEMIEFLIEKHFNRIRLK
jgi:hypothetical protein